MKAMVEAAIKANEKRAREDRAENHRSEQRVEKAQTKARREEERTRREQERADKEAERARKEAERIEREQEERRKKRETVFAEIADLPRMTHAARLKEAAARLGEDPEILIEEFEVFFAARSLPPELVPWPDPVDTAELLAGIEAKFRRYVVVTDAIVTVSVLWAAFTYLVEIASYAPKLVYFISRIGTPARARHCTCSVGWRSVRILRSRQRVPRSTASLIDSDRHYSWTRRIRCSSRSTVLAHIINFELGQCWGEDSRSRREGQGIRRVRCLRHAGDRHEGLQYARHHALALHPLHDLAEDCRARSLSDFSKRDDEEFVILRRKLLRWSVDNAAALQAARPEGRFNNRVRDNYRLLWAIADLAGGEWPKRARAAAIELETERDEPSEGLRLLAAIRDIFGTREAMTSADICAALVVDPSGEWANFRDKGPISQTQLAVLLKEYRIRTEKVSPAGIRLNGYFRAQFKNAFARLLQKPAREPDIRTESEVKPLRSGKKPRPRKA